MMKQFISFLSILVLASATSTTDIFYENGETCPLISHEEENQAKLQEIDEKYEGASQNGKFQEYVLVFQEEFNANGLGVDDIIDNVILTLEEGSELAGVRSSGCTPTNRRNCESRIKIGRFKALIVNVGGNRTGLNRLRNIKGLSHVEQESIATVYGFCYDQAISSACLWGLDHVDAQSADEGSDHMNDRYLYDENGGSGVNVYVLDTGIMTTHKDFCSRARWGATYCNGTGLPCTHGEDKHGHGTHVAGTCGGATYGIAKAASLVAVKVLDDYGFGTYADIIRAINWVVQQEELRQIKGKAVMNMSLGGSGSTSLDAAVNAAVEVGIPVVVAAGNSAYNACYYSPARAVNATTVGSITKEQEKSSFSNSGPCVDVFAPGSCILSSTSSYDTRVDVYSGTSMASPHVAGASAVFLGQNDCATPQDLLDWIKASGIHDGIQGLPDDGCPNLMLQLACDNKNSAIRCAAP